MTTIITSGAHYVALPLRPGYRVGLDIAGDAAAFGGAIATIGYKAADGEFSPCLQLDGTPVTTASRGGFEVMVPRSGFVGVSLDAAPAGAGLTLDATYSIEPPMP